MARRRAFDMCHPSVNLLYFLLVLVCSVGCMHPACLGISLGGALACGLLFRGRRAVGRLLGLLGLISLGTGYWLSATVKDAGMMILFFFVAVLLVIAGTYLLFTSGSITLLKALRKNRRYYY